MSSNSVTDHIHSIAYGQNQWNLFLVSSNAWPYEVSGQVWLLDSNLKNIKSLISEKIRNDYTVANFTFVGDRWFVLLNQNPLSNAPQIILSSKKIPTEKLKNRYNEGFRISHIAWGNGRWVFVLVHKPNSPQLFRKGKI